MALRLATTFLLIIIAAYVSFGWCAAGWLTMPARKPLSPAHRENLARMPQCGVQVNVRQTAMGTPYLDCVPIPGGRPAERGRVLRAQLTARRVLLPPFGTVRGTLVLLHGWGGRKEDLLATAERFCAVGFRCLVPDLPGHGENPRETTSFGSAPPERRLPFEVCADAARFLPVDESQLSLWGMSMDGAWAIQAAVADSRHWQRVVAVSSFDALEPVVMAKAAAETGAWVTLMKPGLVLAAHLRGGMWLPAVKPVDDARHLANPTMVVHGTADDLIPIAAGRRLFGAIASPEKRWLEVTGARHGNVLATPQQVFAEMAAWLLESKEAPATLAATGRRPVHATVMSLQR